jgi:hypothetical protein
MPWKANKQKEGYGKVKLFSLAEAQAYAKKHGIPIVRELAWDRQENSLKAQLKGNGKVVLVSLDGQDTYTFTAIPPNVRPLGAKTPGKCFTDEARQALAEIATAGATKRPGEARVQFDVGRGSKKSAEIREIRKACPEPLETWRAAAEAVAADIGAKTTTSATTGVRSLRAGVTTPPKGSLTAGGHGFHFDGGISSARLCSVIGGGTLTCCITAVRETQEPMILGAHGASNLIDEVGCLCAGNLDLVDEDYGLTLQGGGSLKLFLMERKLPDGTVKYVLYGRAHAAHGVLNAFAVRRRPRRALDARQRRNPHRPSPSPRSSASSASPR